jgi:hypothetical protein
MKFPCIRSAAVLLGLFVVACNGAAVSPDPYEDGDEDDATEQPATTKPKKTTTTKPTTTTTAPSPTATPSPTTTTTTTTTPAPAPIPTGTTPDPTQPPPTGTDAVCAAKASQDECAQCCEETYPEGQGQAVDEKFNNCLGQACGIQDDGGGQ